MVACAILSAHLKYKLGQLLNASQLGYRLRKPRGSIPWRGAETSFLGTIFKNGVDWNISENWQTSRNSCSFDSEEIRTLASGENGALNHRLRPLGHTTLNELLIRRK